MDDSGKKPSLPIAPRTVRTHVDRYLDARSKQPHFFTPRQRTFLEVYSKTLDIELACKESGFKPAQIKENDYLVNEINLIDEMSIYAYRVNTAMGNHFRLMKKFEDHFDKAEDLKERTGLASSLAKMSDSAMRAAGHFTSKQESGVQQNVQVVINLGGQAPHPIEAAVTVESEVVNGD